MKAGKNKINGVMPLKEPSSQMFQLTSFYDNPY